MGVYLSTPKTGKASEDGENERLRYGVSSMQGWRATMEDAVTDSTLKIFVSCFSFCMHKKVCFWPILTSYPLHP